MKNIEKRISPLIQSQFPSFYQEEGENFIAFTRAYYEWLESTNNPLYHTRRLPSYRDIDETTDDFIVHFKEKYLKNIQFDTATNKKLLVKNSLDLYRAKGTERSIDLFFKLVYGTAAEVQYPAEKIFRLSDGVYEKPEYLEIGYSIYNIDYVGKQVVGQLSGAKAFVEKYIRRRVGKGFVNLLYISGRQGDFKNGEVIGLNINNQPTFEITKRSKLIGSMKRVTVQTRGRNFNVGDIVRFTNSDRGLGGLARVESTNSQTGLVDFIFTDGGYGYTLDTESIVSEKVLNLNEVIADFTAENYYRLFERGVQPVVNIGYSAATSNVSVGNTVYRYAANGMLAAQGRVLEVAPTSNTNGFISISHTSGVFVPSATYYTGTNNTGTSFTASTLTDKSMSGKFMNIPTDYSVIITAPSSTFIVGDVVQQQNAGYITASGTVANVINLEGAVQLTLTDARGAFKNSKRMADWDYKAGTGTITVATTSNVVTGTSTAFNNNYINSTLYVTGNVAIGNVQSVTNSTSLILTTNAAAAAVANVHNYGLTYKIFKQSDSGTFANVSYVNLNAGLYDIKKQVHVIAFDECSSNNVTFANNIYIYNSANAIVAEGSVITANYNTVSNTGTLTFISRKGYWNETDTVYTTANADNFKITSYSLDITGGDYVRSFPSKIIAPLSNTTADISSISFGTGAGFGVGTIGETEVIFIGTDLIAANSQDTLDYSRLQLSVTANTGFDEGQRVFQQIRKVSFNPSTAVNASNGFITITDANTYYIAGDRVTYEVAAGNTVITALESGKSYYVAFSNTTGLILSHPANKYIHINSTSFPGQAFANLDLYESGVGTITANTTSNVVTGVGTVFKKYDDAFGNKYSNFKLYDDGNVELGTISTVVNSTSLTLTTNSAAGVDNNTHSFGLRVSYNIPGFANTLTNESGHFLYKTAHATLYDVTGTNLLIKDPILDFGFTNTTSTPSNSNIIVYGNNLVNTAITAVTELSTIAQANQVFASQFISSDAFGFPKNPQGNYLDNLYACLTFGRFEIGIIGSLNQINPGEDYNVDPFVLAHQQYISAFDRKDFVITFENATRNFVAGEIVNQSQANLRFFDLKVSSGAYSNTYDAKTFTVQTQFEANSAANAIFYRNLTSSFNPTDEVNSNTDFITITGNEFAANDLVRYFTDTGNTAVTGLSNNSFYYVLASNSTGVTLTAEAANTLAKVNITQSSNVAEFNSNTDVQNSNNFINIATANTLFANGGQVRYVVTDGTAAVDGLEANALYYVRYANSTGLALSVTAGGSNVDLTAANPGGVGHFLRNYNPDLIGHQLRSYTNEFANGQIVQYRIPNGNTAISGLTANAVYYVVDANTVAFKLSSTLGGAVIDINANSTGGESHTIATLPGYLPKDKLFQNVGGNIVNATVSSVFSNTHESVVRNYVRVTGNTAPITNNALLYSYTVPTANALISSVTTFEIVSTAKAIVKSSNSSQMLAKRITFENTWLPSEPMIGEVSGAEADVIGVTEDITELYPIGLNADITANVVTSNGEVTALQVIDSGFAYSNGEIVDFVSEDNLRAGTAKMILDGHGLGIGYYRSSKGFLSDDIYVHDGDYYQEYSYEILSKISVDRYSDMFKKVMHMAGTKFFGSALIVEEANTALALSAISTGQEIQFNSNDDVSTVNDTIQTDIEDVSFKFKVMDVNNDTDLISIGTNPYYTTLPLNVHDYLQYTTSEAQTIGVGTSSNLSNNAYYYVVLANTTGIKISETRGGDALNLNTVAISNTLELHTLTKIINPFANGDLVLYTTSNTAVEASITGTFTTNTGIVVNVTQSSNVAQFNSNTDVQNDFINIASANSKFTNGSQVRYVISSNTVAVSNLESGALYYVRNANSTGLALSIEADGPNVSLTAANLGSNGHFLRYYNDVVDSFIKVANNKFRNSDYVNVTFDSATCNTQSFNANTAVDIDSANAANVFITISSHPFANDQSVLYYTDVGNTAISGLTNNQIYYVIETTTNTFKLATQSGNTATIANIIASAISETGHYIMRGFNGITNATSYYVMDANTSGFRLSTTGARAYANANVTANTVGVVAATDFIKIAAANSRFVAGDRVYYRVPRNNTALTPLTGNSYYYIAFANTTGIVLTATPGGTNVDITDTRTTANAEIHTFTGTPIIDFKSSNTGLTLNLSQNKLTNTQTYYVVNTTPNTVKLSLTANGSPINITANGTASEADTAGHFLTKTIEE